MSEEGAGSHEGAGAEDGTGAAMSQRRARRFVVSMALIALLVNLPLLTMVLDARRLSSDGVLVDASLVEVSSRSGGDPWVSFRLDRDVDPEQTLWAARVTRQTAEEAEASGVLPVRVLPDRPSVHRVQGQVRGYAGLLTTLVVDGVLVLVAVWWWRARRRAVRPD